MISEKSSKKIDSLISEGYTKDVELHQSYYFCDIITYLLNFKAYECIDYFLKTVDVSKLPQRSFTCLLSIGFPYCENISQYHNFIDRTITSVLERDATESETHEYENYVKKFDTRLGANNSSAKNAIQTLKELV